MSLLEVLWIPETVFVVACGHLLCNMFDRTHECNLFTQKTTDTLFYLTILFFFSSEFRVLEAKVTSLSVPSYIFCHNTALMLYCDASHAGINSLLAS